MVKRYNIYPNEMHGEGSLDTWEEPKGEWVKYEDIKHLLERPEARECKKCNAPHCFCEGSAGSKRPEGEEIKPVATDGVLVVLSNGTSWIHKNGAWVKYDPQPQNGKP